MRFKLAENLPQVVRQLRLTVTPTWTDDATASAYFAAGMLSRNARPIACARMRLPFFAKWQQS